MAFPENAMIAVARGRSAARRRTYHHRRPACPAPTFVARWGRWSVQRYAPQWESLANALRRVMGRTGLTEEDVKEDLCRALADRKINFRVTISSNSRDLRGAVCSGDWVYALEHLKPSDFD